MNKQSLGPKVLTLPTPVLMVGTYDQAGKPNIMTVAWGGICCGQPPCLNVSLRKATYSYNCLMERKAFTVGIVHKSQMRQADYFGMASGREVNKFAATGFTPVKSDLVDAPYAAEFPLVMECKLIQHTDLGLHTIFIGEIMDTKINPDCLDDSGKPDPLKIDPFWFAPEARQYYSTGESLGKAFSVGQPFMAKK